MIVKDLIAKLQSMDPEMEVLVSWDCESVGDICYVEVTKFEDVYDDSDVDNGFPDEWVEINGNW